DGADARTPAAELDAGAGGGAVGAAADAALAGRTLEAFLDGAGAAWAALVDDAVAVVVETVAAAVGAAVLGALAAGAGADRRRALLAHLRRDAHVVGVGEIVLVGVAAVVTAGGTAHV